MNISVRVLKYPVLAIALAVAVCLPVPAGAESSLTLGAGVAQVSIRDPVGRTAGALTWYPELGYRFDWSRRRSVLVHLAWMRVVSAARPSRPHTDTRGLVLGARYAWRWPWTRYFHPHLHIGIEYVDMRSDDRFTVDGEGFLLRRYPPRAHRQFNLLVGVSYHLEDYNWGGWVFGLDWHDPLGLSRAFAGGIRAYIRYRISFD